MAIFDKYGGGGGIFFSSSVKYQMFSLQQVFVDQIFRIFDKDGNGSIDFKVNFS